MGYSTVPHFNLVHVDCHLAAVRQARDEWESSPPPYRTPTPSITDCCLSEVQPSPSQVKIFNYNTGKYLSLLLISAYAACLARHNIYLAEVTVQRDIS